MEYQCGCVRADDNSVRFRQWCKAHAAAYAEAIKHAASEARRAEREDCARVSENCFGEFGPDYGGVIARKIRARSA